MIEVFLTFLRLGMTSFGGPVAHLGFFHQEFVARKKWINEQEYADLVALCQFLPGPASSQIGMAIGFYRKGIVGSIVAWIGFTLPSALLLIFFALALNWLPHDGSHGWLHGLKIAAVAVVAQAVLVMAKKFCIGRGQAILSIAAAIALLCFHGPWVQMVAIVVGAVAGFLFLKPFSVSTMPLPQDSMNHRLSISLLFLFFAGLLILPLCAANSNSLEVKLANSFYQAGALVFGGGHVVLPLLQSSVVEPGWVSKEMFTAGYGAAQAIPGPLFSISAFLGFVADQWKGALICLIMIFLPSFLLVLGVLPYWGKIRNQKAMRSALVGVNAVVVGLLLAALYNPIWQAAIFDAKDFLLAMTAFLLLVFANLPSYLIVIVLAAVTALPFY